MATDAPKWVWWAYYLIAGYFLLGGIFVVLAGLGVLGEDMALGGSCIAIMGLVNIVLGAGLILRWEAIRGVVNVVCFVTIIMAAWSALQGFFLAPLTGPYAALFLFQNVIDFCTAGFMIFLLGETDKKAPNL